MIEQTIYSYFWNRSVIFFFFNFFRNPLEPFLDPKNRTDATENQPQQPKTQKTRVHKVGKKRQ